MAKYFSDAELACRCGRPDCDAVPFSADTAAKLDRLREVLGEPIYLTRGVSCKVHNAQIGGKDESRHIYGDAVDIRTHDGAYMRRLVSAAIGLGFTGIGVKERMVHLDTRPGQLLMWGY